MSDDTFPPSPPSNKTNITLQKVRLKMRKKFLKGTNPVILRKGYRKVIGKL